MANIVVDLNTLDEIANQLMQIASEQDVLTHKTKALLNTLDGAWKSRESEIFMEKLTDALGMDENKIQLLRKCSEQIQQIKEAYMQADSSISQSIVDALKF